MRRGLTWTLAAALALSAVALWVPQRTATIVQAIELRRATPLDSQAVIASTVQLPLPATLEPTVIEPARRDPFAEAPAQPVAPALPVPPIAVAIAPPPPPQPAPPPMPWRLLGTMDSPAGERVVLLVHQNEQQSLIATPGMRLDGGYEISSVGSEAVRLVYPPLQTEVVIPISPPQAVGR